MTFGRWVRNVRSCLGLTQDELARVLNIHWTTLSRWERDRALPSLNQIMKLARCYLAHALDVEVWTASPSRLPLDTPGRCAYFGEAASPTLAAYVQCALNRNEKVMVVHDPHLPLREALQKLTTGVHDWEDAVRSGQLVGFPLNDALTLDPTHGDPLSVFARIVELDRTTAWDGFAGITWLTDSRPALRNQDSLEALLFLERALDMVYATRTQERTLGLYPSDVLHCPGGPHLLSLQPSVLVAHGMVKNPFYGDPQLAFAAQLLEVAACGHSTFGNRLTHHHGTRLAEAL